jgi:hypothetical protein
MHRRRLRLLAAFGPFAPIVAASCAAPPSAAALPTPTELPAVALSAPSEAEQVYRAILESRTFADQLREFCPDGSPWIDEAVIRDPEALGFRWDPAYFEPWLDLVRNAPDPKVDPQAWRMPASIVESFPGHGHAFLRFSRVGLSPDGRRAFVAWQMGRLGVFLWGGNCCLDRGPDGWTLTRVNNTWALSV